MVDRENEYRATTRKYCGVCFTSSVAATHPGQVFRREMSTSENIHDRSEALSIPGSDGAVKELSAANLPPVQRLSALVADDDPIARKLLVRLMTSWGYDVTAVSDGDQAIQVLEQEDGPQLAILDRMMDGAD